MVQPATPPERKRDRGTPTGHTPHRPKKRVSLREQEESGLQSGKSGRRLPLFTQTSLGTWSVDEVKALTEFILFYTEVDKWPTHKREHFWKSAATFVQRRAHTTFVRTGRNLHKHMYILIFMYMYVYMYVYRNCICTYIHAFISCRLCLPKQSDKMAFSAV